VPDQKTNAGNEGDVMKHPTLQKVTDHLSDSKSEFWYVETHAAYPYYFLPLKGAWTGGIGHLASTLKDDQAIPRPLRDYVAIAYHDKLGVTEGFPDKRTYLGSAPQVFHILKDKKKRIRMTLFEMAAEPTDQLLDYFEAQGAQTVLVRTGNDAGHVATFLRKWWDAAVEKAHDDDDLVMVVQGDSWQLAPCLWEKSGENRNPDLVFVDPFKLNDPYGQPQQLLCSLGQSNIPFICWTPLFCVPASNGSKWPAAKWSFESEQGRTGDQGAQAFANECKAKGYQITSCCWDGSAGARQKMYGCQLALGNVFSDGFTANDIWELNCQEEDQGKPGFRWWDKYYVQVQR